MNGLLDVALADLAFQKAEGLDLCETVLTEDGEPLPNATVLIYTAPPRRGTSPLCPPCYADCSKSTQSADDGAFTLPNQIAIIVRIRGHGPSLANYGLIRGTTALLANSHKRS